MAKPIGLLSEVKAARARCAESISTLEERLADVAAHFDSQRVVCQQRLETWQSEQSQLAARESKLHEQTTELDQQLAALTASRGSLAIKLRRRLQRLREKTAELGNVDERVQPLRAELDKATARTAALEKQLADTQARRQSEHAEADSVRDELTALHVEEKQLRQQLAESRQLLNERARQLQESRKQVDSLTRKNNDHQDLAEELAELRQLRDQLTEELAEVKRQLQHQPIAGGDQAEVDELQRKFELAVESLRSVKTRNEELTRELNALQRTQAAARTQDGSGVEQHVLNQLQALNDSEDTSNSAAGGNAHQRTLTDKLLAQKDQQIAKLEAQLTASQQQPQAAPGAANFAQAQQEWLEKQRAAEVELAVARAQNARARQELEEKMRDLEAELALARKQRTASNVASENSQRRSWLAQFRRRDEE